MFVNAVKMHQFKAKDSEIKQYPLSLGNISKDFTIDNMKKTGLKGTVQSFSVDYNPINTRDILDIHRFLMKKTIYKNVWNYKKMFIVFLTSIVNASNHAKLVSLSNQKCDTQPALINLYPNEYSQELHYYPFAVKVDRCVGSCYTLNDLPNKVCVQNKIEDLNIHVFNMITGINESKILTKQISCECKCKFDGRKCNSNQWWNNNKC